MEKYRFCVVGGGVGGIGFIDGLLERGIDDFILLEGRNDLLYTLTWLKFVKKESKIFNGRFTGIEFRERVLEKERSGGKILNNARVFDIDPSSRKIYYYYDRGVHEATCENIVLAVGGVPVIYGDNLLAGYRGAGIFSAYQVGEMLVHYDFLPGKKMAIYGEDEYALDLIYLARECGIESVLIFKGKDIPHGYNDLQLIQGKIRELRGGLRLESVILDNGKVVEVDTLVVAGRFILERGWREKLKITWDLTHWEGVSPDERIVLVGDALHPDFDFARQYQIAKEKGADYGKK